MLQIATGAASRNQGQFSFAISGVDPNEVYETAGKLMRRVLHGRGGKFFLPMMQGGVSNDMFLQTPQLKIDILRDQAASYGISPTRIETLLRNAYSQNYVYLIKRPTNQYQVILETADQRRSEPQNLELLYIKSDDGTRTVPLSAVAKWEPTLGPQSVNHLNQFTSVTFYFNLMPGVALGDATDFIDAKAEGDRAADHARRLPGRSTDLPQHGREPDDPDGPGRVRHVRDPGDSVRELSASDYGAFVAAGRAGRRAGDAVVSSARKRRSTRTSACSC